MPVNIAAQGGGGIFSKIGEKIKKNIGEVQANVQSGLGVAANLNPVIPAFAPPQIDPRIVSSIDKSVFDFSELAKGIIEQSGLKDLIGELQSAKTTKTEKTTTDTKQTTNDTTPTQKSNKPVEAAKQSREEGRTNLEQLFLDLINGKLDVKL